MIPVRLASNRDPVVAAWGMGLDSTAMIVELVALGDAPDIVLTADTGSERPETYEYLPLFQRWMDRHGLDHHVVRYQPQRFRHWPPYYSLMANCLTNATLPSISFSRHSCSLKWKVEPQDRWVAGWAPAQRTWEAGRKVTKLIGYDASPADTRRYAHAESIENPLYDFRYPLREWGWDRKRCAERIRAEGLPVPIKSACFFCGAASPAEIRTLPRWCLRVIVLMEARAAPRLRTVEGLWRRATKSRPGTMTAFIRSEGLLPPDEMDAIIEHAPLDLVRFQDVAALVPVQERPTMESWLGAFNEGAQRLAA